MFIIQRPVCDGGRSIVVAASDYFTSFSSLQVPWERVPWQHVLKDNNNCATLRCMWQGIGKQCKSPKHTCCANKITMKLCICMHTLSSF
ncbi:Protein CBG27571 [Caenorhabditis briggsae]|uniref:Protein CBG27571 n=1 Tax=Caenorhabditis briggsae TaxID=6238 RepID=B6IKN4_CAEBR|nr:Protein CBG27571 [Caenorhabditis briggsae]CAS00464.1 Protein CBG27571 [Caenorhabditis briggsae]